MLNIVLYSATDTVTELLIERKTHEEARERDTGRDITSSVLGDKKGCFTVDCSCCCCCLAAIVSRSFFSRRASAGVCNMADLAEEGRL